MTPTPGTHSLYRELRQGQRTLRLLARLIRFGFVALGVVLFLEQSRPLLSDSHFTWGERQIMGLSALVALAGCGFAGWVLGHLIGVVAEVMDIVADTAEAATRTSDLIERHVVPSLARIASALEQPARADAAASQRTTHRERT
jgi:hypothetical protein